MSAVQELRTQTDAARALVGALLPILENDDELHRDMVEGETGLHDAIRHALARIVEIRTLVAGINATLFVLGDRGKRLEDQEERIRAALLTALEIGGLSNLETSLGTVSRVRVQPSVIVTNAADIPWRYLRYPEPEPKKAEIKAALKRGEVVPGATLGNGSSTVAIKLT